MKLMKVIEKCEERLKEAGNAYGDCYITSVLEELLLDLKSTDAYREECDRDYINSVVNEKLYTVKVKSDKQFPEYLVYTGDGYSFYSNLYEKYRVHRKSELEKAGYGGVFDNPMFVVEEVN